MSGGRAAYVARLLHRTLGEVAAMTKGAPVPPSLWDDLVPADQMFVEAMDGYEAGVVDKKELDQKAVGYLNHWRDLWQHHLADSSTRSSSAGTTSPPLSTS